MSRKPKLGRGVAVVGAGMSKFGMFPEKDSKDLFVESFLDMRKSVDKGFDVKDIDALYLGNFTNDFFVGQSHWGAMMADIMGLAPKPATRVEGACASSALSFREGVLAIASGMADMVLVGGVEQMSTNTTEEIAEGLALAASPYENRAGLTFPAIFGTIATAYFHKYGVDHKALQHVTVKSHENAPFNPKGQIRKTIPDMMAAKKAKAEQRGKPIPEWEDEFDFLSDPRANPSIAWPMMLFDCCPISDGAATLLLVAEDIAKDFTDTPIRVAGLGQGSGRGLHAAPDLTSMEATKYAAAEAYAMAGITAKDVQFCEVHDCFSIAEIIHTEDLGFFEPGKGHVAVAEGKTKLDGAMPINTSGGLKCKGHPVGATGAAQLVEVWTQLRQQAGERQMKDENLRLGAAHNLGGTGGTCTLTILERN